MRIVQPGQGDRADFPGLGTRYLIPDTDTDGRFALLEHEIPPRALAAPVHVHESEDEYSFVLSGRVGFQIGEEVAKAKPGELVFKPRGVPHAFWNAGDEPARLLELVSPGGFARFFAEAAPHLAGEQPDFETVAAVQAKHGLRMDFDSIGPLAERHGLRV